MPYRYHAGFTLIELLMVIAIIALLAGMLVPVIGTVRAAAKKSVCANQLRQIGMAFASYSDDHDGLIPYGYKSIPPWDHWYYQVLVILDFYPDVTTCIADPRRSLGSPQAPFPGKTRICVCPGQDRWFADDSASWAHTNYTLNMGVMETIHSDSSWSAQPHTAEYFKVPSRILLVADGKISAAAPPNYNIYNTSSFDFLDPRCVVDLRHNKTANALYLDTHIDTISATSTFITDFN